MTLQRKRPAHRLVTAALLFTWVATAAELPKPKVTVEFDPARTTVEFTLGDVLHKVHGVFTLKSGIIDLDPATGKVSGSVVIDATSGDSGSGARDRRMHKNVLESDRYSEMVFTPDRVEGKVNLEGPSQVQVHGVFRIHGIDHELTLAFQARVEAGQVTATTEFPVPYAKWGMKNPSNFVLKVNDTVTISIRAIGRISLSDRV